MVDTKTITTGQPNSEIIIGCNALILYETPKYGPDKSHEIVGFKYNPLNFGTSGNKVIAISEFDDINFTHFGQTKGTLFIYKTKDPAVPNILP
jgi:hypothetical protein